MRDYLFRGKRLDNGEMVFGFLVCDTAFYGEEDFHCYIVNHEHPSGCFGHDIYIEVDPDTLGQYTGIDIDGVKVFEGDIVRGKHIHREYETTGVVVFDEDSFVIRWCDEDMPVCLAQLAISEAKVIGNRWNDPELLEAVYE